MNIKSLQALADLLHERNEIDRQIAETIGRPVERGHVGEFIAADVFNIRLEDSATNKGNDGVFNAGPLEGLRVNVKFYGKREGCLDLVLKDTPDHYLVLTGAKRATTTSRGTTRPWTIEAVYLFEAESLVSALTERGCKLGTATSVADQFWEKAQVWPTQVNAALPVTAEQNAALQLFSPRVITAKQAPI